MTEYAVLPWRIELSIKASTASLYGFPWFDFNDKFFWCAGDEMAGNLYHTWDQEGQFFYFSYTEGNAHISSGWKGLFRVISYANSIINDMPPAAAGKVSEQVINRALGEAGMTPTDVEARVAADRMRGIPSTDRKSVV